MDYKLRISVFDTWIMFRTVALTAFTFDIVWLSSIYFVAFFAVDLIVTYGILARVSYC